MNPYTFSPWQHVLFNYVPASGLTSVLLGIWLSANGEQDGAGALRSLLKPLGRRRQRHPRDAP